MLPAYAKVEIATLLSDISATKMALDYLSDNDRATLSSPVGISTYNAQLIVSNDVVREIVVRQILSSLGERILKVKKPDYLGASKRG